MLNSGSKRLTSVRRYCHIYQYACFLFFVFNYYIWPICCNISACVYYYYYYYYPCYHPYVRYSQLYTQNKPCHYGIYSVAAVLYLQFALHVMLFRTVFTIIYPKQTTSLRYTVLQLFCIYSLCYM